MKQNTAQVIYDAGYCIPTFDIVRCVYIWHHGNDSYEIPEGALVYKTEAHKVVIDSETKQPLATGMYASLLVAKLEDVQKAGKKLN